MNAGHPQPGQNEMSRLSGSPRIMREVLRRAHAQDFSYVLRQTFETLNPGKPFVEEWHVNAIAYLLERIRYGKCTRAVINLPPRSLKSTIASVALPAFLLGLDPTRVIVCASYSRELARKLHNDFRAVITSPWYRHLYPRTIISKAKDTQDEIELTERGGRIATSVGGTLTGRGGDLIIIDDPLKAGDAGSDPARSSVNQWYVNTVLSRLNEKKTGAILLVMQRLHTADLTAFMLQDDPNCELLSLPAIAPNDDVIQLLNGKTYLRRAGEVLSPEREPLSVLEALKRQMGGALFSAQYLQAPVPPEGAMIKREWLTYGEPPPRYLWRNIVQSWDTANKGGPDNDFSVCTTWLFTDDERKYLLDVYRCRVDYPTLKVAVVRLAHEWKATQVFVEESGTAVGLLAELQYEVSGIVGVKPERDKISRMSIVSAQFEAKQVIFPERAPWLADLEAELLAFPEGVHDDQVDSISQALQRADNDLAIWAKLGRKRGT